MNQLQIIGTAFEYAQIAGSSARIRNEIDSLMGLLLAYKVPTAHIELFEKARELATTYHFKHSSSALAKELETTNTLNT